MISHFRNAIAYTLDCCCYHTPVPHAIFGVRDSSGNQYWILIPNGSKNIIFSCCYFAITDEVVNKNYEIKKSIRTHRIMLGRE